jgi:two-component system cell cycle sensor histidine kinase/response regulator CckA
VFMRSVLIYSADEAAFFEGTCLGGPSVNRVVATDPRTALRKAREHQPRLTVVDAAVPGAAALIRRLRQDLKTRDTGIAALSGTADLSDEPELRRAGANLVLARPINAADWDGPLQRLLDVPPRRSGRLPATFEVWDGPDAGTRRLKGTALNISLHGVLLECSRPLPIGTKVDVVLTLPSGEVRGLAEVVRDAGSTARRFRRGVQFLVLRGDSADRITRFVGRSRERIVAPPVTLVEPAAEARQWETELRASEARIRSLLETAPDAVVLFDHQGRAREMNDAAEAMFGVARDEALGRASDRLLPNPLRQLFRCALAHQVIAVEHLLGGPHEIAADRSDGRTFVAELRFRRFTSKGCVFWAVFARDVTKGRKLAEELNGSQRRFQALVEYSADGIALVERDGRLRYLTASAAALFGYLPSELMGHTFDELVACEDVGEARQIRRRALQFPGVPMRGEVRCRHRDGSMRVIEGVVVNHLDTPEVRAIVINYRDATHRHRTQQLEEELRQAQKIEALGRLAGGVAHDFNNLIGVIMGASRLAADRVADPETQRRLDQVQRASEKAAALTHQLLAFSRKQVLMPQVVDVGVAVHELTGMLDRLVGDDIELVTVVPERAGRVQADRSQLEQALTNLVVNARDAMTRGGTISIRTSSTLLDDASAVFWGLAAGRYVVLSVRDTGEGMTRDVKERVFEPFYTTKKDRGTGLGLSMVHGIITQSGGQIKVDSEPGVGTTFTMLLPVAVGPLERSRQTRASLEALAGTERILLVEDETSVRNVASEILTKSGYTVMSVDSSQAALDLWLKRTEPFDLVLTDVVMPGMTGWALGEQLHAHAPTQKIIYMSGYSHEVLAQHGAATSSFTLLQKPFTKLDLLRTVRHTLDRRA